MFFSTLSLYKTKKTLVEIGEVEKGREKKDLDHRIET
jgi:hypothetical protein